MLSTLWADLPGLRCVVGMRGKVTRHWWFETTEDAEAKASALDEDKWNVYYSPTLYDPARVEARQQETDPRTKRPYTGRAQDCAALLPALWLDLDCGEGKAYTDQAAALAALSEWQGKANVPPPSFVVSSGYGLHVYWQLDQPAQHDRWLPVAKHLKQACRVLGLEIDPARTADAASLMRFPGTHNYKRKGPRPVTVLGASGKTVDLQAFRARLPVVGPVGSVPSAVSSPEWDTTVKLPPAMRTRSPTSVNSSGRCGSTKARSPSPCGAPACRYCGAATTPSTSFMTGRRVTPGTTPSKPRPRHPRPRGPTPAPSSPS